MTEPGDRHTTPRRPIGIEKADWDELGDVVGDRNRADLVRRMVRAFLKRPGAKMPTRAEFETKPKA
jgi:hypothetical protein